MASNRYTVLGALAKGGMASVFLGRMQAESGFTRLVAIKRLHAHITADLDFVTALKEEARLAACIRHANVIQTLDLAEIDGALSLVLEYVEGESLHSLVQAAEAAGESVPLPIAVTIVQAALRGLEAAHEARSDDGERLGIVHRDVSPHNLLVGVDGNPRVIDFGIAKALGSIDLTRPGEVRGKIAYMPPEQLQARPLTRQVDVYAIGVVLWELLTGERLFAKDDPKATIAAALEGATRSPREINPLIPEELDAIVMKALARDLGQRYLSARELANDLTPWRTASEDDIAAWVRRLAAPRLAEVQNLITAHDNAQDSDPQQSDDAEPPLEFAPTVTALEGSPISRPLGGSAPISGPGTMRSARGSQPRIEQTVVMPPVVASGAVSTTERPARHGLAIAIGIGAAAVILSTCIIAMKTTKAPAEPQLSAATAPVDPAPPPPPPVITAPIPTITAALTDEPAPPPAPEEPKPTPPKPGAHPPPHRPPAKKPPAPAVGAPGPAPAKSVDPRTYR